MLMGVCTRGRHNREGLSVGRAGDELSYKCLNLSFSANTDSCQQGRDSDKDKTSRFLKGRDNYSKTTSWNKCKSCVSPW